MGHNAEATTQRMTTDDATRILDTILFPTLGKRETSKRQTQFSIRMAALELFKAQGITNVTVEQIAAKAEISPRTFFNYFSTKEECVLFPFDLLAPAFEACLRSQPLEASAVSVVGEAGILMFGSLIQYPGLTDAVRSGGLMQNQEPTLLAANRAQLRKWEDIAQRVLQDRGVPALTARIVAVATIASHWVAILDWAESGTQEPLDTAIRQGLSVLEGALLDAYRSPRDPGSSPRRRSGDVETTLDPTLTPASDSKPDGPSAIALLESVDTYRG